MLTTPPYLFVPALLLLLVGSVSAETVTFCSGGCNTGRPQSGIPGVAHGKAIFALEGSNATIGAYFPTPA